jgi:hypothetical protein
MTAKPKTLHTRLLLTLRRAVAAFEDAPAHAPLRIELLGLMKELDDRRKANWAKGLPND